MSHWFSRFVEMRRIPRSQRHHLTAFGDPKLAFDRYERANARMQSHLFEDRTFLEVYCCATCHKWHLGRRYDPRRRFPIVDRELFHLEIGGRATACMWDESYRDESGRMREVRRRVVSAQRVASRWLSIGTE